MDRTAWVAIVGAVSAATLASTAVVGAQDPSASVEVAAAVIDGEVHLNEIQVVGSHNSYHEVPPPEEAALRREFLGAADDLLQYRHEPLPVQLQSQKVRQIELDIFLDSAGGTYADPLLRAAVGGGPYDPAMNQPGIKVMHVQDVDYHTTCLTLKDCLGQVEAWSDANPTHAPIAIMLELKDELVPADGFPFVVPEPFDTPAAMDTLDAEIRSVMGPDDIIAPDDVRGARARLDEAVTTDGWPTLGESRGKVMFLMDNAGPYRDAYRSGAPTLEGRPMFTNAEPGDPDAGFETDFVVEIPGGTVARCNPINGPASCVSGEIDTIFTSVAPPVEPPTESPPPMTTPATPTAPPGAMPDPPGSGNRPGDAAAPAVAVSGRPDFTG